MDIQTHPTDPILTFNQPITPDGIWGSVLRPLRAVDGMVYVTPLRGMPYPYPDAWAVTTGGSALKPDATSGSIKAISGLGKRRKSANLVHGRGFSAKSSYKIIKRTVLSENLIPKELLHLPKKATKINGGQKIA